MCKCNECMFGNQKEVDCNGFSCGEFYELQEKHDKQIVAEVIDECIQIVKKYYNLPTVTIVEGLEKLKEQNNG